MAAEASLSLDAVDLKCPLPVLKTRKALAGLAPGAVLEVLANDPGRARISKRSASQPGIASWTGAPKAGSNAF